MLEESLEVATIAGLPAIVFRCIEYLEKTKADQEEGIYRLSGSSAVIKSLKDKFNSGMWSLFSAHSIHRLTLVIRGRRGPASLGRILGSPCHSGSTQEFLSGSTVEHSDA
jgi:hypothetical protein